MRIEVVRKAALYVFEAEDERGVRESALQDVLQVALARCYQPGAALSLLAKGAFGHGAGVGGTGCDAEDRGIAAAIARGYVEDAGAAIAEARRPRSFEQFHLLHHVGIERGARSAGAVVSFQHVKRLAKQDAVEVEADAAVVGAAQRQ